MTIRRYLVLGLPLWLVASIAGAQTHTLSEPVQARDCFQYDINMTLKGELRMNKDGKTAAMPLAARAEHRFSERILEVKEKGLPAKVVRNYDTARSSISVNGQASPHDLRTARKLIVAQRTADNFLCYSPAGPLTRDEVELVSEHFDTLAVTGLLPEKEVKVGDSWKLPNEVVLALGQFEALIAHEITAKLESVDDGFAVITIGGKAQGIELGALAKITVSASARYEILRKRLVRLEWAQKDERDQGPASPACTVESSTVVKRAPIETPKELNEASLESVPKGFEPPPALTLVYHRDAKDRYDLAVTRDWNLVAQTDTHLVLRLIERGELVAQASLTAWTKAEEGKHTSPEEFKRAMAEAPGWTLEDVLDDGEVPTENGRWLYRVVARGTMDDVKVVQNFFLLAAPSGEQVVITFTMKPGQAAKIGSKDMTLVGSIGFPKK